jgi:hypothetical protein
MIDELHNLKTAGPKRYDHMLNAIRFILNAVPVALVAAGTPKAISIVNGDEQLRNRLTHIQLPKWSKSHEDFDQILDGFEALYPLKKPSDFENEAVRDHISSKCDGTIGGIAELLRLAATKAIASGKECITLGVLESIDYVSPSKKWAEPKVG